MEDNRHQRLIYLRGAARSADIRTATFDGTDRLVIPIVALVGNAVVRPLHSDGPEFVPAEELSVAPSSWDGRPVVPDHPDNGRASANLPQTLESYAYGQIFHTEFTGGRLRTEAWIDPLKADRVGGDAARVASIARRALAGEDVEMIEVSVGAWVTLVPETGISPDGIPYEYRWSDVVPDHLAVGLNGSQGACSVEMGCGGPRTMKAKANDEPGKRLRAADDSTTEQKEPDMNQKDKSSRSAVSDENLRSWLSDALELAHDEAEYLWVESIDSDAGVVVYSVRAENEPSVLLQRPFSFDESSETVSLSGDPTAVRRKVTYEEVPTTAKSSPSSSLPAALTKVLSALGLHVGQDEGASDVDLREMMDRALRSTEPGYYETVEIFPSTSTVIYVTIPEDSVMWWRRTYDLMDDGSLSLNDDREQIEPVTRYEPVAAAAKTGVKDDEQANDPSNGDQEVVKSTSTNHSQTDNRHVTTSSTTCECTTKGSGDAAQKGTTMNMKEVVDGLIANEASPFTEDDNAYLTGLSKERLSAFAEKFKAADEEDEEGEKPAEKPAEETVKVKEEAAPASDPSPASAAPSSDPAEVRLTRDEYEDLSAAAKELKAQKAAEKSTLVAALAKAQDGFSQADLEALDLAVLRKMSKAHKLDEPTHDYSGRGLSSASSSPDTPSALPKPWTAALTKARSSQSREEAN